MRWELDGPNLIVMPDSPYLQHLPDRLPQYERTSTGTVGVSSQSGPAADCRRRRGRRRRRDGGRQQLQHDGPHTSDNKFLGHAGKKRQDILHETDKIRRLEAPRPSPERFLRRVERCP